MADLVAVFAELASGVLSDRPRSDAAAAWRGQVQEAIDELRRRARVERRLEAWLSVEGELRHVAHYVEEDGQHSVVASRYPLDDPDGETASDYWTAADAALTAAGAPKEEE